MEEGFTRGRCLMVEELASSVMKPAEGGVEAWGGPHTALPGRAGRGSGRRPEGGARWGGLGGTAGTV